MNNSITKNKIDVEEIKYDVIPNETIVDYIYSETSLSNEEILSKFDLRSVNGNEYVTPVKNQMSSGLCWAFATNSQIESYLLVKNNTPYQKNVSKIFSERQLDYATSINGILDYDNEKYGNRLLFNGGGNFYYATDFMKNGLGLVDSTWKEFVNNDLSKMELNKVFNYKNSNYEVNNILYVPEFDLSEIDLTKEENLEEYNNYLNIIKELVMNNGGAFVGTQGPTYSCSALNSEDSSNSYIIREDEYCTANANHAMHIIGRDDNYSYKYCVDDNEHGEYTSDCKNSVSGKGAWILKNSWGDADKLDFVYLSYDSLNSSISVVTDISSTNNKKWNNSYKEELNIDNYEVKRNDQYVIRNLKMNLQNMK